jgi:hypothetical protein
MDRFLTDLVQRSKGEAGRHFDKSQVARSLLKALMDKGASMDFVGVKDESDLVLRVLRVLSRKS